MRYRCKFVSASNSILAEAVDENPPHGGHKGSAAGKEDPIHFAGVGSGAPEQHIYAVLDGC